MKRICLQLTQQCVSLKELQSIICLIVAYDHVQIHPDHPSKLQYHHDFLQRFSNNDTRPKNPSLLKPCLPPIVTTVQTDEDEHKISVKDINDTKLSQPTPVDKQTTSVMSDDISIKSF